ncbi:MAG TPA: prepilin-type N-terminal cleavage/methylation domain-containing protein [Longimicrobiales bacterium]|nr:prepilin-type N-terminal cleavage/methylation domain-containing protein [Longimicrobiales bacterium]
MRQSRFGFSVIELVIALLIGGILTSIALSSYGNAQGRFAVRGARDTFASLHARARAQAIEKGATVRLMVDVTGDSIFLLSGGTNLETIHFADELHVDIRSSAGNLRLCMNSRGYADTACNSFTTPPTVTFWQNADSTSVSILPLGQLVY